MPIRFLIDYNCKFLRPGKIAGPTESDAALVRRAYEEKLTIVTNNEGDFVRHILTFQKKLQQKWCHELLGLVVVPNTQIAAERFWASIRRGVGSTTGIVAWREVRDNNLIVGPPDARGRARLRRFHQCFYCRKFGTERPQWVETLPPVRLTLVRAAH